jgi:hypothetical protein
MERNNLEKMNQGARVIAKVLQFVFWLFIVVGGFLIIGGIVVHFMPDHYFVISDFYKGDLVFEIEGLFKYEFTNELGREVMLKPIILLVIPGLLLSILFYLINLRQLKLILKTVIANRPFDEKNSKSLFIMSMTFIAASFIFEITGTIIFSKIFETIGIVGKGYTFTPDFTMLFTGVLLFILSGVFKYGNYLQEEYDETV